MHLTFRGVNDAFRGIVSGFHGAMTYNPDGTKEWVRPNPQWGQVRSTSSRNGDVLVIDEPVTITYTNSRERVLFNQARDCNPFFHVFESLYFLAGRNDVAPLAYYNSKIAQYSDDGETFNGTYGYRWRHHNALMVGDHNSPLPMGAWWDETDQLKIIIDHLKATPDSRRAVLQMWNVEDDLLKIDTSKDVCCNLSVLFLLRPTEQTKALDMTVLNRSNDACLTGPTKFRSPEGDTEIATLAKRFQTEKGFKFPIYAVDTVSGDQRICWMSNAWKTGIKPILKVTFDDGSVVRLTGDHKLFKKTKMFEGKRCVGLKIEERQVCDLRAGDSVLADVPEQAASRLGKYVKFKKSLYVNTTRSNMELEHRAYWEFMTGETIGDDEIHHEDEDSRNNRFENLERLTVSEHRSHHMKKSNPNNKMTPAQVSARASKGGKTHKGRVLSAKHRASLARSAKKASKKRLREADGTYASNHRIVSIEQDGYDTVYDFTVPGRHNAVLSNGVVAHNCWGMLGANVVHMSILQEYVASHLGVQVGNYHQVTNNLHVYLDKFEADKWLKDDEPDYYHSTTAKEFTTMPLVKDHAVFDKEVVEFVEWQHTEGNGNGAIPKHWQEPFIQSVARPMMTAFYMHKCRDYDAAAYWCSGIEADDWRIAATQWIEKRKRQWEQRGGLKILPSMGATDGSE